MTSELRELVCAPIAGSDDRKLMATLRDGDQPSRDRAKDVQVAAAGNFAPAYFDKTPMSKSSPIRNVPSPPDRPYAAEEETETADAAPVQVARQVSQVAKSAPAPSFDQRFPGGVQRAALEPPPSTGQSGRLTSAVSAYAPPRYDASAGFMSGRGLY